MPEPERITYEDRLLAEAVRFLETASTDDGEDAARRNPLPPGANDERRIVSRALSMSVAEPVRAALRRADQISAIATLVIVLLALAAGVGAVGAVMGTGREAPVNILVVLVSLLGVQTALLLLWLFGALLRPRLLRGASIGGFVAAVTERLFARAWKTRSEQAALRAFASAQFGGDVGRWTFGVMTHAAWLAFNIGVVIALFFALSTRNYVFVWETTILSQETYATIFQVLGRPHQLLGIQIPGEAAIETARMPVGARDALDQGATQRRLWGSFLLGAVVIYGLAPRFILASGSLLARRAAQRRMRLDLDRPYYASLLNQSFHADAGARDDEAPADSEHPAESDAARPLAPRPAAAPAVIGVEMDTPETGWPPPLGPGVEDLGIVDEREARTAALRRLRSADTEPAALIIAAQLDTTPDRGIERYISELAHSVSRPAAMLLTPGRALHSRHPDDAAARQAAARLDDWSALARRVGVPAERVFNIDLDYLTDASRAALRRIVSESGAPPARPAGKIDRAFDAIADAVERGRAETEKDRLDLHTAIARLYGAERSSHWLRRLDLTSPVTAESVRSAMTGGARRMTSLLPEWLRSEPKWLAAGAVAGALGCASAALLVTPLAISSLPLWSGFGAALGSLGPALRAGSTPPREDDAVEVGETVRAAALWAALLEAQGMSEDAIRRILAEAFPEDRAATMPDRATTRAWLDEVRRDLERAARREVGA